MGLDSQGKLDIIKAQKGPLEHELFAAETDLETKKIAVDHSSTGVGEGLLQAAEERVAGIQAQLDALDAKAEEVREEANRNQESLSE